MLFYQPTMGKAININMIHFMFSVLTFLDTQYLYKLFTFVKSYTRYNVDYVDPLCNVDPFCKSLSISIPLLFTLDIAISIAITFAIAIAVLSILG